LIGSLHHLISNPLQHRAMRDHQDARHHVR
jgi:hypothetical protein